MVKRKPYIILFFVALIMLVYSFASKSEQTLIINVGATYFVTKNILFYQIYSVFIIILGLIYLVCDRIKIKLYSLVSYVHILGILLSFLLILYFNYQNNLEYCEPNNIESLLNRPDYNSYLIITLLTLVLFQLLFIINIFASTIKHIRGKNKNNE